MLIDLHYQQLQEEHIIVQMQLVDQHYLKQCEKQKGYIIVSMKHFYKLSKHRYHQQIEHHFVQRMEFQNVCPIQDQRFHYLNQLKLQHFYLLL